MAKITIIGTSGAGKTVFITVLAERYSKIVPGQPYMEYSNAETKLYSAGVWGDLVDEQEWPSSTPAGTIPVLEWILRTPSGESHEMCVLDSPGQDMQAIYMPKNNNKGLSENQKILKRSIDDAEVLILLVNLCDVANAKSVRERTDFRVPIAMAARSAFARNARVAILFSQHDQLRALLEQEGLNADDPMQAVDKYIPELAMAITSAGHSAYVGFVAAVAETESVVEQTPTGEFITRSRPKKGFASEGLANVMNWIAGTLRQVTVDTKNSEIEKRLSVVENEITATEKTCAAISQSRNRFILKSILSLLCFSFVAYVLAGILGGIFASEKDAYETTPFRETNNFSWRIDENFIGADNVVLENSGPDTWLAVEAVLTPNNYKRYKLTPKVDYFAPGSHVIWKREHNFEYGGGKMSVFVKTLAEFNEAMEKERNEQSKRLRWIFIPLAIVGICGCELKKFRMLNSKLREKTQKRKKLEKQATNLNSQKIK